MKLFSKIKEGKNKKIAIVLAVVAVCGIVFAVSKYKKGKNDMGGATIDAGTTTLQKQDIVNSISVSGNIKSTNVVNVTTTLNYKVKEILVKVGDHVKKGQVIAKLDSTELSKEIAELKAKLSETQKTAKEAYEKSTREKNQAYDKAVAAEKNWENAKKNEQTNYAPYKSARDSISLYINEYDAAFAQLQAKGIELNNAQTGKINAENKLNQLNTKLSEAENAYQNAKTDYDNAVTDYNNAAPEDKNAKEELKNKAQAKMDAALRARDEAKAQRDAAQTDLTNAQTALSAAESSYNTAKNDEQAKKASLDTAKAQSNFDVLEKNYQSARDAVSSARQTLDSLEGQYEAAADAEKAAKKTLDNAANNEELKELNNKYEQCTIKSEANGVITNINAVVGSASNTSTLAVIQDVDSLVISTSFKEYDIANVKIGQKVIIKSDATGDKVIEGHISQISLTADSSQGSSSVAFPAEITIDTANSGLLVGMNAKAQVVLQQAKGVFVVPSDVISKDENGNDVIYVQKKNDFTAVKVTKGISNDYYVQISGEGLEEGMTVKSNAQQSAGGAQMTAAGEM